MVGPSHQSERLEMGRRIERDFFARSTLEVAQDLLGKRIVRVEEEGRLSTGLITETEAYISGEDLACHAKAGRTPRNEALWGPPGMTYVYFTYGMHWLLNFVTEKEGFPAAVLVRAVWPERGVDLMERRRGRIGGRRLTDGPAKLCQAFAIDGQLDNADLCQPDSPLYLEWRPAVSPESIHRGPRVGINSVPEPWKSIPWRFWIDFAPGLDRGEMERPWDQSPRK